MVILHFVEDVAFFTNVSVFRRPDTFVKNWGEDDLFITKLKEICAQTADLSSAEILNLLLEELDLCRIISSWGNKQQRLDNVDVLRQLALQYENACNRLHTAASLGGFLLWLNDLESNKKDMQGSGEGPNAVNVMTYHKSKGLEYPLVICYGLEGTLRADVWGIDIIPETEEVDLDNVLGNRWLRYWVNPYNDQYRGTPLAERIEASEVKSAKTAQALQEEARLLYVGLTRARDYLVIPTTPKPTKWLNRVWHNGNEDYPTLDADSYESPWTWNNKILAKQTELFPYPKDFPQAEIPEGDIHYLEARFGRKHYTPYHINPENEGLNHDFQVFTGSLTNYTAPLSMSDDADAYQVAKMLKAGLVGFQADYPADDQVKMLEAFIQRYQLEESLKINDLHQHITSWMHYLVNNFSIKKIHRKYPVRYFENGRLFERLIDFLLETDRGYVIIQSSGFSGDVNKLRNKALELGNFFYFSKCAVEEIFKTNHVRTIAHFVLHGAMLEVEIKTLHTKEKTKEQLSLF
ncbi:MAG: 3'-5' exonuclease [Saprospiraceae bacterium]